MVNSEFHHSHLTYMSKQRLFHLFGFQISLSVRLLLDDLRKQLTLCFLSPRQHHKDQEKEAQAI